MTILETFGRQNQSFIGFTQSVNHQGTAAQKSPPPSAPNRSRKQLKQLFQRPKISAQKIGSPAAAPLPQSRIRPESKKITKPKCHP
jgi:hypothetical protein